MVCCITIMSAHEIEICISDSQGLMKSEDQRTHVVTRLFFLTLNSLRLACCHYYITHVTVEALQHDTMENPICRSLAPVKEIFKDAFLTYSLSIVHVLSPASSWGAVIPVCFFCTVRKWNPRYLSENSGYESEISQESWQRLLRQEKSHLCVQSS